jgi:hypothetical protein
MSKKIPRKKERIDTDRERSQSTNIQVYQTIENPKKYANGLGTRKSCVTGESKRTNESADATTEK